MTGKQSVLRDVALALTVALSAGSCGTDPGGLSSNGQSPLITEFLSKNQSGLTDEDGEPSDWIEIFNPDVLPVDLSGYHLTDLKANMARWTFPEGTVMPPSTYLVVFASGKGRAEAGKPLHTNFKGAVRHCAASPRGCVAGASWV